MNALQEQFLLDPEVTFLNHGSFGACPRPVFEAYQRWQVEMERQPVEFFIRRHDSLMAEARQKLGDYLKVDGDHLFFVPNATVAVNTVARSLELAAGDEILTTNHEYGALDLMWSFFGSKRGVKVIRANLPLPMTTVEDLVERFWAGVTPRTKIIFLSHISSPTALRFPVEIIVQRAREAGILTIIDGAHAPGQIPLDLQDLGADFYAGNCHKWLCAPKGAGFLYARPEHHAALDPLVISWGWVDKASLVKKNEWQGTCDIAAFLSVPAAIRFQADHHWEAVRERCHALAGLARSEMAEVTGQEPISPDSSEWFVQMVTLPLPDCNGEELQRRLYEDYRIEIPHILWEERTYLRASFQAYNTEAHVHKLVEAVKKLLPECPPE